jgi:DNA helicase-2/ATP-dependent DNA helicase PcrA
MDAEEYLSVLNPQQKAAVVHDGSSLLILAGAGSGKTRVITTKIAYLISQKHVDPSAILAVTFTKKAAKEMQERAVALEPRAQYAQIRTFHSFGAYFLRLYAEEAGVDKNFTVYDDDDMVTLVSKSCPGLTRQQSSQAAHKISLAKDYCMTPDSLELGTIETDPGFPDIYAAYQKRLRATGNCDFGDLIMLPYLVLKNNEQIRARVHYRYRVIMVDEYQDSNVAQFLLLQQLAGVDENAGTYVCVVGDDDQSIYKFRGAEVQNILNFQKQFPGTSLIRLEQNYRSTSEILHCADEVVSNNNDRLGKTLVAVRGKGKTPTMVFLPTQDDETQFCAELIQQAHKAQKNADGVRIPGVPYRDWAILYRTNAQSLGFETEFLHRKIPYTVVGSLKFYEREEIKDALAWLAFVANPKDEIGFRRIINKPARGIGDTSQDKVIAAANGTSLVDACRQIKLSKKAEEGKNHFCELVEEFEAMVPGEAVPPDADNETDAPIVETDAPAAKVSVSADKKQPPSKKDALSRFVEKVIESSGLVEYHKSQDEVAGTQKVANLQELVNSAVLYPCTKAGLLDFLDHIELDRTMENADGEDDDTDRVTLITLHNTKGLEFPRVIITGLESGIFPREDKTGEELEEERRLFYVGITRARDELYLTSCGVRRIYGTTKYMSPSPFLKEIGKENVRMLGQVPPAYDDREAVYRAPENNFGDDPIAKKYCVGTCIYHDEYGHGQIVHAELSEEGEYVISVSFDTGGVKKFLPKYQAKSLLIEE